MMKKQRCLLVMAAALCVVSILCMVLALGSRKKSLSFTPPPFEETARTGTPEVPEELGWGELDAKTFRVSVCGRFIQNGTSADVWLTNPESNHVWLKLRVIDQQGNLLGETGLVKPGEYVQTVELDTELETDTKIILKIMAYQADTYYSEGAVIVDTVVSAE